MLVAVAVVKEYQQKDYILNITMNKKTEELKYFKGIKFHEEEHFYTLDDYRFGISATSLIESYSQEFDSDKMSQLVASKRGIAQYEVLQEWKKENEYSCIKGSIIHLIAQNLWMKNGYHLNLTNFNTDIERLQNEISIMEKQAISFYNDYKDMYEMIQDEFIVWSKEFDIAGSIDGLMYNKLTDKIAILDFKSNKNIEFDNKYKKYMKVPLNDIPDTNLYHYYIQLSIYKYLIEYHTKVKIDELFIVYFNVKKDNYEIIEVPYLKKEVEEILEIRRVKNMKSIPILLMGASGTGKTRSLKNLPIDETAIINVTNKPLPFKNNGIKVVSSTDYLQIIKAIKETEKKIIVIDDCGYLLTFENFDKATNKGYDKFTIMAQNFYKLIEAVRHLDNEKIVYIITHEEVDDDSKVKPKMIGKMLNQQLCVEGLFTIVLRSVYKNGQYVFETKTDGTTVTKSPEDMFSEDEIPNDLAEVDRIVREYYGFSPIGNKNE